MVDLRHPIAQWAWQDFLKETPQDRVERALADKPRKTPEQIEEEEERAAYNKRSADAWSAAAVAYAAEMHGVVSEADEADQGAASLLTPLVAHFVQLVRDSLEGTFARQPKVLDIASGPGEPALSIALAVPKCAALAADIAPGMVEEADRRSFYRHARNLM